MVSADPSAVGDLQGFFHIRILIGLVTGLSVTRILTGLARFVQDPEGHRVHGAHLAWAGFLLLYVFHFWWAEFGLLAVHRWQFQDFVFVVTYAALIFVTATLLFPDRLGAEPDHAAYFAARRTWFYGLLLAILCADLADSVLKGAAHLQSLGGAYAMRQALLAGVAITGLIARRPRAHLVLACGAIAVELGWILTRYRFLE